MVMCSEPVTRTPASGLSLAYFLRMDIRPGISNSAIEISFRPQSASLISATLYSVATGLVRTVLMYVSCSLKQNTTDQSSNHDLLIQSERVRVSESSKTVRG